MSRRMDAPIGFECPYRHKCPHMEGLSTTWVMEVYQESFELRERLHAAEARYQERIEELEKALLDKDRIIARLRLQHQKRFKANSKDSPPPVGKVRRRRGAPVGHPPWRRREPDPIDQVIDVAAPAVCPHCQCERLLPCADVHRHIQEDIVLMPRTCVTQFVHQQSLCPRCRRAVHQTGPGELRHCDIGPVARAVATHLRYDLQIPYRKVQHLMNNLFGLPMVHATAMNFDRKASKLGLPLYQQLQAMIQSADVVHADETSWREDGQNHFVWFAGNDHLAVYRIQDNRSADSAVQLLGNDFAGTLISDDYAAYNAVEAKHQQTCWNHLRTKAGEIQQQIQLIQPPIKAPRSLEFCDKLQRFALRMCKLGQKLRNRTLSRADAKAMIPALQRQLLGMGREKLEYPAAETLRQRVMEKDWKKLLTFLRVRGVEPTNNHAERSLRFLVIMRKVCFGTRSPAGSQSHGILASLLQTAKLRGQNAIQFLTQLLTEPQAQAEAALFGKSP